MSCRGCVCGSGSPSENVPPSTAAPTKCSRWRDVKRIAAAFQAEPGDPKLDARSYVAGFKMGVKIGLQDAAYSTYADNIESAGRPVEDLRDLDSREGERWHE